jgi:hypothetical protein
MQAEKESAILITKLKESKSWGSYIPSTKLLDPRSWLGGGAQTQEEATLDKKLQQQLEAINEKMSDFDT